MKITGDNIYIEILTTKNISKEYADWLNDVETMQFIETERRKYSYNEIIDFVKQIEKSNNDYLFGIFDSNTNKHIGSIKLGNINYKHSRGDIGLIIGEKKYWGKGIATEAIKLITYFAFNNIKLNKVYYLV